MPISTNGSGTDALDLKNHLCQVSDTLLESNGGDSIIRIRDGNDRPRGASIDVFNDMHSQVRDFVTKKQ